MLSHTTPPLHKWINSRMLLPLTGFLFPSTVTQTTGRSGWPGPAAKLDDSLQGTEPLPRERPEDKKGPKEQGYAILCIK